MVRKVDRRIQKTRATIKKAFIELLNEEGFWSISVNSIATRANINRGTFYLHYEDKFDFFEKYVDELLNELTSKMESLNKETDREKCGIKNDDTNIYMLFFKHFQINASFYKPILSFNGGEHFYSRFIEIIKMFYLQEYDEFSSDQQIDKGILINFLAHAQLGVISSWLKEGMVQTPEYMGSQLSLLLSSLVNNYGDKSN